MPSFVVVAGADVEMADLEAGNGISARIDLNLHLAPPTTADFLRLGSGPALEEEQQQQQQQQQQRQGGQEQAHLQRRILPRFGPGIHGVFLDLHQEGSGESEAGSRVLSGRSSVFTRVHEEDLSESLIAESQFMRPPIRHRIRRYSRSPSVVRIGNLESRSRRLHHDLRGQVPDCSKDKDPVKDAEDAKDDVSVKRGAGSDNFECNVCLDIAVDPVVTVCGHLFCWHCLYQWLYVHSDNEECPVCKGLVVENCIIPIYGRGSSSAATQQHPQLEASSVPPRPHARRIDSPRQRLEAQLSAEDPVAPENMEQEGGRLWSLNEVLRMRNAIRFLRENMGNVIPTRRLLRRRMSERREHYRTPAGTQAPAAGSSQPAVDIAIGDFEARAASLQQDYVRQLSASRSETVAAIRARLANLVETIESHRRHAASITARLQDPDVTVMVTQPGATSNAAGGVAAAMSAGFDTSQANEGPSFSVISTATRAAATADTVECTTATTTATATATATATTTTTTTMTATASVARIEVGEGSSSGSGDIDSEEVLPSRKRRRLN